MCGIVGYVGTESAVPILLDGLGRLEYRGYDSAGVAYVDEGTVSVTKRAGKVAELAADVGESASMTGLGHTRWATHGAPTTLNAHPHLDCTEQIAIVHNGIIENHRELRERLESEGHEVVSETDSELLAHLVERGITGGLGLASAVRDAMKHVEGSVAMVAIEASDPSHLVAARRDSPLLIGLCDQASIVASDIPAILPYSRDVIVMSDGQVADLAANSIFLTDADGNELEPEVKEVSWDLAAPEKAGYDDFMLKEIYEQPSAVRETIRGRMVGGRLRLDGMRLDEEALLDVDKAVVVACGTSFHAGLVAKYAIEHWARLPVEIDIASEFRYRDPVLDDRALVIAVSQSGETADTVAAVRHARDLGARVIAVCNVVDSSMAREADAVLYTHAGPEVGVAATKTFTAQLAAMELLALYLAQVRGQLSPGEVGALISQLEEVPGLIESNLERWRDEAREMAREMADVRDFFFLGRGVGFPIALEGALKLKEISYLHAEGYPAGEMKHGPIALVEPGVVVFVVATESHIKAKVLSNLEEIRARGATIAVTVTDGDDQSGRAGDFAFYVPPVDDLFSPLVTVVPYQLLAYEIAKGRGLDVDKPRNLAKVVTVE